MARAAEERLVLSARAVPIAEKSHEALDVRTAENLQRARLTLARTRVALVQTQIDMQHLTGRIVPDA